MRPGSPSSMSESHIREAASSGRTDAKAVIHLQISII